MENPFGKRYARLIILCSIVFFFGMTIKLLFDMAFYETMENKRSELYDTAEHVNTQARNKMASLRLLLMGLDISSENTAELERALQDIYHLGYFRADIYDFKGNLTASSVMGDHDRIESDDTRAFQAALSGRPSVSGKLEDHVRDGGAYVVFNVPILGAHDEMKGVLAAYMYISELDRMMNEFYSDAAQCYVLVDETGNFLSRPQGYAYSERLNAEELFQITHTPKRPNDFLADTLRSDWSDVYLYLNLEYTAWRLVKVMAAQNFYEEIFWTEAPFLALILLGNFLIGAAAWLIYRERNRSKIQEKMRIDRLTAATRVAAGIAHEIKNPLTAIKGFIQLIEQRDEENQFAEYTGVIRGELGRIELLTNQFSTLAKPATKEKYEAIDLYEIVTGVVRLMSPQVEQGAATLVLQAEAGARQNGGASFEILGSANQIKQVLMNLIKNAAEATMEPGEVKVKLWRSNRELLLEITDNGAGIRPEDLEKIGTPFFTTKENGTGLGMMISFEIIRQHGGTTHISSVLRQGTSICIRFPARD